MSAEAYKVRLATSADYDSLVGLMAADFKMHRQAHPNCFKSEPSLNYDEKTFVSLIEGAESAVWVAEQRNEAVGIAVSVLRFAGCAVGHHMAVKQKREEEQQRQRAHNAQGSY